MDLTLSESVRSAESYVEQLRALFPRGRVWPEARGPVWTQLLRALAEELRRVDGRFADLLNEADPRTAFEALEDYERVLGLPDACFGFGQSIEDRRRLVVAILLLEGGQTPAYFKAMAALFGQEITEIIEGFPAVAGVMRSGDNLNKRWLKFHAGSKAGTLLGSAGAPFAWWIKAKADRASIFRAGSSKSGDSLLGFGNTTLECLIGRFKPAHTKAHFIYNATEAVAALEGQQS